MTDRLWLYPRLPRTTAERLAARLKRTPQSDREVLAALKHPRAAPAPTGGAPVPEEHLVRVAHAVRSELRKEMREGPSAGAEASVDARLGRILHEQMRIIPSDAAQEGVWSFMSLVLLPDVAAWRFPDCHPARLIGTHRNVFRRTWWRQHVLGDVMVPEKGRGCRPLGEDELVGIFERSRMARSQELAKCVARYILGLDVQDRSAFARELAKRVRRVLAYINVDVLDRRQIERIIDEAGQTVKAVRNRAS